MEISNTRGRSLCVRGGSFEDLQDYYYFLNRESWCLEHAVKESGGSIYDSSILEAFGQICEPEIADGIWITCWQLCGLNQHSGWHRLWLEGPFLCCAALCLGFSLFSASLIDAKTVQSLMDKVNMVLRGKMYAAELQHSSHLISNS